MPVNDGSNIRLIPLQPMQLPDMAREVGSLLTAMRRASGGGGGGDRREKGASLFNPVTKKFEFIPGGSEEERQRNLQALVNFQLNERFRGGQTKASQSINEKLKSFGNSSVERQAQILEDIRRNDIPALAQQTGVDGQLFTDGPLAQLANQQKTNAKRVEETGTGSILWDSLRTGWRSFTDGLADIFSDSQEQMSRANARQQYVQNIQAENAYLRNRELRRQEGADFLGRLSPSEVIASTGEFLGENLVPLGAAVAGGAIGAAAGRALGASARAGSFAGQAVPGGLLGMGSQLSTVGDEIINNPDLTLEQKQQALEDAKAPAMALGGALGAMVLPAGQMARRGLASTRARLGLGDSYVARTVQARRAGRPIPNGLNSWDDALSNARRDDMLAENAIINGGFGGRWRQQMADSMLEGAGFAGLGQIGTNAIVGNDLTENLGSALAGGTLGGALFTPFNRRTPYTYNQIPAIRPQILALGAPGPQAGLVRVRLEQVLREDALADPILTGSKRIISTTEIEHKISAITGMTGSTIMQSILQTEAFPTLRQTRSSAVPRPKQVRVPRKAAPISLSETGLRISETTGTTSSRRMQSTSQAEVFPMPMSRRLVLSKLPKHPQLCLPGFVRPCAAPTLRHWLWGLLLLVHGSPTEAPSPWGRRHRQKVALSCHCRLVPTLHSLSAEQLAGWRSSRHAILSA